jgi:hypothetical protein
MLIDATRLELALTRLAESDERYAELKGEMLRSEYMAKHTEAVAFKAADGTVEDRKMTARLAGHEAWEKHFRCVVDFESLKAKREREMIVIECWRSLESSRRQGNI